MAGNYVQRGDVWKHTAGGNITSGSPVLMGDVLGVALVDITSGATGSVAVGGVFTITKLTTDVVAQGAALYWDAGNSRLTTTASTNKLAGYAASPAGNGDTTVQVRLKL
jgi:predicted RecA/RadA family phage recombinase